MKRLLFVLIILFVAFPASGNLGPLDMPNDARYMRPALNMGWVNIEDYPYMARGDDSIDDAGAVLVAEAVTDDNGGIIFFPPGTFILNENVTVSSNVIFQFAMGAKISVGDTYTLTFASPAQIIAPLGNDCFDGTVSFVSETGFWSDAWDGGTLGLFGFNTIDPNSGYVFDINGNVLCDDIRIEGNADGNDILHLSPTSANQMIIYDGNEWTLCDSNSLANYAQTLIVAKSGGNYTSIQDAIDSITDANSSKRYAVKVMPGDYAEAVTMENYVDIIGSGRTNSRITGTSGTVLTFPSTKATVMDMGIYVNYGELDANSVAITSAGGDSVMLRCDITVAKSAGDFTMKALSVTGGAFRMSECFFAYSITGATTDTALNQAAVSQTGALTTFILANNEIIVTSNEINDQIIGFETLTGSAGTYLLENNIVTITTTGASDGATGFYLYGTATGATIARNRLVITGGGNAWGYYIDSTAGGATVDSIANQITTSAGGANYWAHVETGDTLNSSSDVVRSTTGYVANGTVNIVSSSVAGALTATGNIAGATYGSDGTVSNAELLYINSLTSNAQTQIDSKMARAVYDTADDGFVDGNDTTYALSWNGNINAPSMNTMYDYLHLLDPDDDGKIYADEIPDFNEAVYNEPNVVTAYDHSQATTNVHGLTFTSEGTGGGLDSDTVDGQHALAFEPTDPNLTGLAAVDPNTDDVPYWVDQSGTMSSYPTNSFTRGLQNDANGAERRSSIDAQKKFQIDVTEAPYCATGDGETVDSAAIQAAIDAVEAAGGGIVFFPIPIDTYYIGTNKLVVKRPGVILLGANEWASVIKTSASTTQEAIEYGVLDDTPRPEESGIYHLGIDGNNSTDPNAHGIKMWASAEIDHCYIRNCGGDGIYTYQCWSSNFSHNKIYDCNDGLYLGQEGNAVDIYRNIIIYNRRHGLYIHGSITVRIVNNDIEQNDGYGVYIKGNSASACRGLIYRSNHHEENGSETYPYEAYMDKSDGEISKFLVEMNTFAGTYPVYPYNINSGKFSNNTYTGGSRLQTDWNSYLLIIEDDIYDTTDASGGNGMSNAEYGHSIYRTNAAGVIFNGRITSLGIGSQEGIVDTRGILWRVFGRYSASHYPTIETGDIQETWGTAAPVSGTYTQGDIVWNTTPTASGNIGWVCVTGGTPGTWKTFGIIAD